MCGVCGVCCICGILVGGVNYLTQHTYNTRTVQLGCIKHPYVDVTAASAAAAAAAKSVLMWMPNVVASVGIKKVPLIHPRVPRPSWSKLLPF